MNVSLTPELEQLVNEKVASGMYGSASEVIREALRLFKEQDRIREHRLEALRSRIALGIQASERGDVVDGEEFLDQLLRENREEAKAKRQR